MGNNIAETIQSMAEHIQSAYNAIENKGIVITTPRNLNNLASNITAIIGGGPFEDFLANSLTKIDANLLQNITSLKDFAFAGSTNLRQIEIPNNIESIGKNAFQDCVAVIVWGDDPAVTNIAKMFCYYAGTSLSLPGSVTTMPEGSLEGCSNLTHLVLPFLGYTSPNVPGWAGSLGELFGRNNYSGASGVSQYCYTGENLSPGNTTFYIPSSLREITIESGLIPVGAFDGCSMLTTVNFPQTSVSDYTFRGCTNLTTVNLSSGTASIGEHAFDGCTSLQNITLPDSLEVLSNYTFQGCSGLTDIALPNSLTSIGAYAFKGCSSLTDIVIPDSVTSLGIEAFHDCASLTSAAVGNGVQSIGDYTFYNCSNLANVVIGSSVANIGTSAFQHCTNLASITIPNNVASIGSYTFSYCTNMAQAALSDNLTSINSYCFQQCVELQEVSLGNKITQINAGAFENCPKLVTINYAGTMDEWTGITKVEGWDYNTGNYVVHCTDGDINK